MSGKVVQIEAVSDETLQLAEVEVYGRIAPGKISSSIVQYSFSLPFIIKNIFKSSNAQRK